jgi:hypothetical protein
MVKELFEMRKSKYGAYCIAGWIALIGALFGSISWFIRYVSTLTKIPSQTQVISPIDIAGITATLGGLVLVGAFYEANQIERKEIAEALKRVGKEILVSSVCFIIIFFMLEYIRIINTPTLNPVQSIYVVAADFFAVFGILSLSIAMGNLITIIRFI